MDIEQTLRAACEPSEPAAEFEAAVMKRVSAAAWRATQAAPRRRGRILLIGALVAVAAAAALFTVRYSGYSNDPVALSAQEVEPEAGIEAAIEAPGAVQPAAAATIPVAAAIPPTTPTGADINQQCTAAYATPAPPRYTVLVQPLQFEVDDPALQSRVREYYDALREGLRKIPGLALVGAEGQTASAKPADFRVTVRRFDDQGKLPADRAQWKMMLALESWSDTAFKSSGGTIRAVRSLDADNCPVGADPAVHCGPAGAAVYDVSIALGSRLPRYPTPAQAACNHAYENLVTQSLAAEQTHNISMARSTLERLATTAMPTSRYDNMGTLRRSVSPELVPQLVTALREATDDAFRKELVTLLAVTFSDDPAARAALAAVAASAPDSLMRHVAERAVSGNGPWRDYAVARINNTDLPTAQRLEAWYWMADAMPLGQEVMEATLKDTLTALQERDGVRVLANLLADTQKNPADPGFGVPGQQGQWTIRKVGSVNHPAAIDLLIACFDAEPNYITLSALATRRDDPRIVSKLESIAAEHADLQLRKQATSSLSKAPNPSPITPTGN